MTKIEEKLQAIFSSPSGPLFQRIHEELVNLGLRPKDNNKTILYFYGAKANGSNSLAAFRLEPRAVFSLPKSYWEPRRQERLELFSCFNEFELQPPNANSPSENKSGGQVIVSSATIERIVQVIRNGIDRHVPR